MNARLISTVALTGLLGFSDPPPGLSGWGSGSAAVAAPERIQIGYTGWQASDESHILGYFIRGVQVSAYNAKTHVFRSYDAASDTWGPAERAPWVKVIGKPKAEPCADGCDCDGCEDGCKCANRACSKGCPCVTAKEKRKTGDLRKRRAALVEKYVATQEQFVRRVVPEKEWRAAMDDYFQQIAKIDAELNEFEGQPLAPKAVAEPDLLKNPGVVPAKIKTAGEEYRLNGNPISPATAKRILQAEAGADGKLPDDAKLIRLTVIGSKD